MALFGPGPTEVAVVSPSRAAAVRAAGAFVVDARPLRKRVARGVSADLLLGWRQTCRGRGREGRLPVDRAALAADLRRAGVPDHRPVLVVDGGPRGWGEGARVAWTLAQLGHPAVAWMAGEATRLRTAPPAPGAAIHPTPPAPAVPTLPVALLDVRSPREFRGATPHGEARGGHLPGAHTLPFSTLWTAAGSALGGPAVRARLADLGIPAGAAVRCLCTGGVRSAAATLLLREAGVWAENDDGGMWVHAADPTVSLER